MTMGTTRVVFECHPVLAVRSSLKRVMCCSALLGKYNVTIPTATMAAHMHSHSLTQF